MVRYGCRKPLVTEKNHTKLGSQCSAVPGGAVETAGKPWISPGETQPGAARDSGLKGSNCRDHSWGEGWRQDTSHPVAQDVQASVFLPLMRQRLFFSPVCSRDQGIGLMYYRQVFLLSEYLEANPSACPWGYEEGAYFLFISVP